MNLTNEKYRQLMINVLICDSSKMWKILNVETEKVVIILFDKTLHMFKYICDKPKHIVK